MPWIERPSLASRTRPTKLARPPTSRRPFVRASSSRPTSKSSVWTRTRGTLTSGDRREERHLVAGLKRRSEVRHLLVHGDPPLLARPERVRPAALAGAQLVDERGHGVGGSFERYLLARTAERLAEAG